MFNPLEPIVRRSGEIEKLCNNLKDGIEWVYPYTGAHRAAFNAYLMKPERMMAVEDNPEDLMNQAIERATRRSLRPRLELRIAIIIPSRQPNPMSIKTSRESGQLHLTRYLLSAILHLGWD
jgi:hypothetical protein